MNIAIRLFAGYFLIVGLAAWFVVNIFAKEVEPGVRQATEDTLVDTANVFAELVAGELASGGMNDRDRRKPGDRGAFAAGIERALARRVAARIYDVDKTRVELRVLLTDARGTVVYDSAGDSASNALGADYSQWRDIARVLRGEYGARSTRADPDDPQSSVMYVAAPVMHEARLVGVVSVAKPANSLQPYADRARERMRRAGFWLLLASGLTGVAFTLWLTWSLNRLRDYARTVAAGGRALPPTGGGRQLSELARALAEMRARLDGKQYVEHYVQSLAHEMKSPLTAIRASAELLAAQPLGEAGRFAGHIDEQAERLQQTIERMLLLARIEQLQAPEGIARIAAGELADEVVAGRRAQAADKRLELTVAGAREALLDGDRYLLRQALANLVDNAIDFSPTGASVNIDIVADTGSVRFAVRDAGPGVPDFALPRLFERFYSLPRPDGGRKSTGLGLAFVREVARLHGGEASVCNAPGGGALAALTLPRAG